MKQTKNELLAELQIQIESHCTLLKETFQPLDQAALTWQPTKRKGQQEWSILQCFDHLNLTHDYYMAKLQPVLVDAPLANASDDQYSASFWGGIYMFFALNPKYTFPSPEPVTPVAQPGPQVLSDYLMRQEELSNLFAKVTALDLIRTRVPIEKFVHFNLGDCLKILVYHDALHIGQAQRVYAQYK